MLLGNANRDISEPQEAVIVQRSGKEGWKIPKVKAETLYMAGWNGWNRWFYVSSRTLHTCHCKNSVKRNLRLQACSECGCACKCTYMFTHLLFTLSSSQTIHPTLHVPGSSATRNTQTQSRAKPLQRGVSALLLKRNNNKKTKSISPNTLHEL